MSDGLGSYAFVAWMRRGAATQITRIDGTPGNAARATFPVTLGFNADTLAATATLELYGAGEIGGIDARTVIRTWPRSDDFDAESNFFPLVEFDQPDLPWRYTSAAATPQSRLRPWIALIVVTADEIDSFKPPTRSQLLPVVTVKNSASLPNLDQSWAWAHVQVSGRKSVTPEEAAALFATAPHSLLSRVLCPRQMQPKTAYRAMVVPAFERGRLAGLGQSPDGIDALEPAWKPGGAAVQLPVYYEWRFQTGVAGDFEYLVRLLKARAMPATVGVRPMDARTPDPNLPLAQSAPLPVEGALKSPAVPARTWNVAERAAFVPALRALLNRPAELLLANGVKIVAPPLYGRWHAARETIDDARGPAWFIATNDDPRDRVAAGMGTQVVQDQQEKLMASAWRQVDRIREINEKLRLAQLAREGAVRVHARHLASARDQSLLLLAAPVLARVKGSPQTIAKLVADSPIGSGVFEAQFRRVARPRGPLGRRQGRTREGSASSTLLERMNSGTLQPAPPPAPPPSMVTPGDAKGPSPPWLDEALPGILLFVGLILLLIGLFLLAAGGVGLALGLAALAAGVLVARAIVARLARRLKLARKFADGELTAEDVRQAPAAPAFTLLPEIGPGAPPPARPPAGPPLIPRPGGGSDSFAAAELRGAIAGVFGDLRAPRQPGKELRPISIPQIRQKLELALDPKTTIAAAILPRLQLAEEIRWPYRNEDPLEPIMAAPEFEQPMYEPLRDPPQDQNWILPGLEQVPSNTISLLLTNQVFVEAYMLGLNHEMGRELLWREYPTDQRGTYFRQFWDVRGYVGAADRESLRDIRKLPWPRNRALGKNSPRPPLPGDKEHLVLLVRGDLLRRYPTAIVYAVKARKVGGRRELTEPPVERHPIFRGALEPDVRFFGFELTEDEVKGGGASSPEQGWFFMIQEQPAEPRFGFDFATYPIGPPTKWNDLSWAHFAPNAAALSAIKIVDLNAAMPNTQGVVRQSGEPAVVWHADAGTGPGGARASDIAYITLQRPVRIAVHGTDMLP
jgi:hypothetical protein